MIIQVPLYHALKRQSAVVYMGILLGIASMVPCSNAGWNYQRIRDQGIAQFSAAHPESGLLKASDGLYYGTTTSGGVAGAGTIFRLNADGSAHELLHTFSGRDGYAPTGELIETPDGMLWGTTSAGGIFPNNYPYEGAGAGTVFRINKDGTQFEVRWNFGGANGQRPSGLVLGAGGRLFGATSEGGFYNNHGVLFSIDPSVPTSTVIHRFKEEDQQDGIRPFGPLLLASDGYLYGTTSEGGTTGGGTVFRIDESGENYTTLFNGASSQQGLTEGSDGMLYGVDNSGRLVPDPGHVRDRFKVFGAVFRVNKDGSDFETLHLFGENADDGTHAVGPLLERPDGFFYGTTLAGGAYDRGTVFRISKDGSTYERLYDFGGADTFGADPRGPLVEVSDNGLLGTVFASGESNGHGGVYRIQSDGSDFTELLKFDVNGFDGVVNTALRFDGHENLYGFAAYAGAAGAGTFFKLSMDGSYQVLREFDAAHGGPRNPTGLLLDETRATAVGVSSSGGDANEGTVFALSTDGSNLDLLHQFGVIEGDGKKPRAAVILSNDGNYYGTTSDGGVGGFGTVFKTDPKGENYVILHHFGGSTDGATPVSSLVEGSDGLLYGTTSKGGGENKGTVFRINKSGGSYSILHSFMGPASGDGDAPVSELVETTSGHLLGTTQFGGNGNLGTVYRLNKTGAGFAVLHSFSGPSNGDGAYPVAGLVRGIDGKYYGTTMNGGIGSNPANSVGTIFRIKPDGSEYEVIRRLSDSGAPLRGLTTVGDSVFYGSTTTGGIFDIGTIFKIEYPLRLIGVNRITESTRVISFDGDAGREYEVFASDSLANALWTSLGTFSVDGFGEFQFQDSNANDESRFYFLEPVP